MDDEDRLIRQGCAGVERCDRGVVPLGDLAQEDLADGVPIEVQVGDSWNVVDHHDRAERRWDVQHFRSGRKLRDLRTLQRRVGRPEIDRLLGDLCDATA